MEKKCECGCGQTVNNRFMKGHSSRCRSKVTRRKLSESHKGKHLTAETLMKMREAKKGKRHPMYGKHHTKTTLIKMREVHKRENLSEETLIKMSESHKGEANGMKGRHHTKESNRKNSESQKKYAREHPNKVRKAGRKAAEGARKAMRKNSPYRFSGVHFDSKEEALAMQILCEKFGIAPIEGRNCHIKVNGGEIDFRPVSTLFVEYHPWDCWRGLTHNQYYNQRRKLLDDNGFQKYRLIVTQSLDEVKKVR